MPQFATITTLGVLGEENTTLVEVDLVGFAKRLREDIAAALEANPGDEALRERARSALEEAHRNLKEQGASEELLALVSDPMPSQNGDPPRRGGMARAARRVFGAA